MVRALETDHRLTFDEYIEFEKHSDVRHDLVDGHLYAFAGATDRHNLIAMNIAAMLWNQSLESQCRVYGSDMKVRISQRTGYYPDVMVACDPEDNHRLYRARPCLIVEVLSPSTMLTDRREKAIAYQSLESLRGYLMVYRDQQRVESYTRDGDSAWVYQNLLAEQDVWFPCVDLTTPVHALYRKVDMSPITPDEDEPDAR